MFIRQAFVTFLLFGAALSQRGSVVFLGDSITAGWAGNGRATWDEFYAPLGAKNTGVSGDRTTNTIDRINNQGIIDNLNATLAVLKIGTNDLSGNVPEATVATNIEEILRLIRLKNPGARTLLLGVLPRTGAAIHERIRTVNALISRFSDNENVFFFNMELQFSSAIGTVDPALFNDGLHLTAEGYRVWARTMNPLFNFLYGI